jgi:hypothetical protein
LKGSIAGTSMSSTLQVITTKTTKPNPSISMMAMKTIIVCIPSMILILSIDSEDYYGQY